MTIAKSSMTMKSIEILGPMKSSYEEILTPDALSFLQYLHQNFNARRLILLQNRCLIQTAINQGKFPNFPEETKIIREDLTWKGAIPAPGLIDRRVEITGPVDRKMIINALNSGATQFMADLEG
jgi:malate synthase